MPESRSGVSKLKCASIASKTITFEAVESLDSARLSAECHAPGSGAPALSASSGDSQYAFGTSQ